MKCRLCDAELTSANDCKAHIMSRGLLKSMSPEELGNLLIVGTDMDKKKRIPNGSYDINILCRDCDNKLGVYDKYALDFVTNSKLINHPSGVGWTINGVDQAKLKLFCLSYLWRASITNRPEFAGINLGTKHEENIRQLLSADSSGNANDYTTIFSKFDKIEDNFGAVMFPAKTRIRGIAYYEAYLPKLYKFWVKVDSQNDAIIGYTSLGGQENMFVHNRGDFDTSLERKIMVRAAMRSN